MTLLWLERFDQMRFVTGSAARLLHTRGSTSLHRHLELESNEGRGARRKRVAPGHWRQNGQPRRAAFKDRMGNSAPSTTNFSTRCWQHMPHAAGHLPTTIRVTGLTVIDDMLIAMIGLHLQTSQNIRQCRVSYGTVMCTAVPLQAGHAYVVKIWYKTTLCDVICR